MTLPAAWRGRWWTWALPLAFAVLNAALLIVHPGRTGAGNASMEKELGAEAKVLATLTEKERAFETALAAARSSRAALGELYQERFSTRAERLTRLITEVKRLAQLAGLEPASISYPEETLDEYGLVRMALVFVVQGTYPQLRTLVNLLELSDLFLVLERVGLRDSQSSILGISLQVSTFFANEAAMPATKAAADGPSPGSEEPAADESTADGSSFDGSSTEASGLEQAADELFDDGPAGDQPASEESVKPAPDSDTGPETSAGSTPSPRSPRS